MCPEKSGHVILVERESHVHFSQDTSDELKNRGVEYQKIKTDKNDGYVVGKDTLEKFTDYTYRTLGTPFTVIADTGIAVTAITVVSVLCVALRV